MKEVLLNMDLAEYGIVALAFLLGWLFHCMKAMNDRAKVRNRDEAGAQLIDRLDDLELMEAVIKREVTLPKRVKALMRNVADQIENADDTDQAAHFCRVLAGIREDIAEERENLKFINGD